MLGNFFCLLISTIILYGKLRSVFYTRLETIFILVRISEVVGYAEPVSRPVFPASAVLKASGGGKKIELVIFIVHARAQLKTEATILFGKLGIENMNIRHGRQADVIRYFFSVL